MIEENDAYFKTLNAKQEEKLAKQVNKVRKKLDKLMKMKQGKSYGCLTPVKGLPYENCFKAFKENIGGI